MHGDFLHSFISALFQYGFRHYTCCAFLQVSGHLRAFFHLCLVSVIFSNPSLNVTRFYKYFFASTHIVNVVIEFMFTN